MFEQQNNERVGWWNGLKRTGKIASIILAAVFLFLFYVALDANKYQALVHVVEGEGRVGVNPTTGGRETISTLQAHDPAIPG